jgi:cell division septal protein FtsQ
MHEQRYNEIAARGERRRRRDRMLIALRLAAAGLALALAAELACALWCSPRFRVRQVRLVNVHMLAPGALVARAAIPPGATLMGVSTRRMRRDLLAMPAVAQATVARDWPSTLVITIRERTPAAFIRRGQGIVFLDRRGVAFAGFWPPPFDRLRAGSAGARCDTSGVPELVGVPMNLARLGRMQKCEGLSGALAALAAAQEAGLAVTRVAWAQGQVMLRLADDTALRVGAPQRLRLKLSQAKVALMQLQAGHRIEYIDVSCPDAPVWKPRAES